MIDYIKIEGFKSIKSMELKLHPINILIGSNGSGKSNFISFFKLIDAIFNQRLQQFIIKEKTDNILYFGKKKTKKLEAKLIFTEDGESNNAYAFGLAQTDQGGLYIDYESSGYNVKIDDDSYNYYHKTNIEESLFAVASHKRHRILQEYISTLKVFHFHDTSSTSLLRQECDINDNRYLKQDGRNLPAFLYLIQQKHPKIFRRIVKTIQSVAPYINSLILAPGELNKKEIELRWVDKGDPESSFSAYQLSDGTLRFIALATLLLQPDPPAIIIIDEPELGLHPFAIAKLAGMIQVASSKAQIIAATQSPGLVSCFSPGDIIVVDRSEKENQSIFDTLDAKKLELWLQDENNTLGDLWERNIINAAQPFSK